MRSSITSSQKGLQASADPAGFTQKKLRIAKETFQTMLQLGIIQPSSSQWSSPIHMVPRINPGQWRPCGDDRALNDVMVLDRCPIPYLRDFSTFLNGKTIFSRIDLVHAYNQIPVVSEGIPKMAITAPFNLFDFVCMTFGLRNVAQTFQRFMDQVTRGSLFLFAFIDDV